MSISKFFKAVTVLGAIAVAAALVYYRGAPTRPAQHPLLAELDHLRNDTQLLLDKTTRHISIVEPACTKLGETVTNLDARCRDPAASVEELQRSLNEQTHVLHEYEKLVENDEGAVLPGGKYMSVETVYRQYAFEQEKHRLLNQLYERRSARRDTLDRVREAGQQRLAQATKSLADLRQARDQLQQQTAHIELLVQTFSAAGLSERSLEIDVKRLQREIAAIQGQIDVQCRELPDTIIIEQLEPVDTSLVRKRKVDP